MKICLINNLYKPFNRGGAEKITETIANGLIKAGHEVFVIATKPCDKAPAINQQPPVYYLSSCYYNLGRLPKFLRFFWQIWNMFDFISYFKIKNMLAAEKCEMVITNNLMGVGFLTPLAIRSLKIKHLHIAHDIQLIHPSGLMYHGEEGTIDGFCAKIYTSICRWLFSSPQAVIFPSVWLKDLYIKRNFFAKSKINVLPNPVETVPSQTSELSGNFRFLFLGQIEKHKGVFLLIDAFNKMAKKYPEAELILVGDGSIIKEARQKAADNNNIKFLGWPGDIEADKLLFSASCLVYPSLVYENCPNAIQRALAAGLPVLVSSLGGIPELLNKNAGFLFKPANANDLAEKMGWMVENRNNPQALTRIDFEVKNYIKELINL